MGTLIGVAFAFLAAATAASWGADWPGRILTWLVAFAVLVAPFRLWANGRRRIAELEKKIHKRLIFSQVRVYSGDPDGKKHLHIEVRNCDEAEGAEPLARLMRLYRETGEDIQTSFAPPIGLRTIHQQPPRKMGRFNIDAGSTKWISVAAVAPGFFRIDHSEQGSYPNEIPPGTYIAEIEVMPHGETRRFQISSELDGGRIIMLPRSDPPSE